MKLHFVGSSLSEVTPLLRAHHYLGQKGRRPADPVAVFAWRRSGGLLGDSGDIVAALVFSSPAARAWNGALELVRLVRVPDLAEPLSAFVAASLRHLRKQKRYRFVVSYADEGAGHHGGIYQACNFLYLGLVPGGVELVNDVSGETCSRRSFDQRSAISRRGWSRRRTSSNHLYCFPLLASPSQIEEQAGRKIQPFPKPDAPSKEAAL